MAVAVGSEAVVAEAAAVGLFAPGASVFGQPVGTAAEALEIIAVGAGGGHSITSGSGKIQTQLYHRRVLKMPGWRGVDCFRRRR